MKAAATLVKGQALAGGNMASGETSRGIGISGAGGTRGEPVPRRLPRMDRAVPAPSESATERHQGGGPAMRVQPSMMLREPLMMERNSRRVASLLRNSPSMREVTMVTPGLWMPRVVMH